MAKKRLKKAKLSVMILEAQKKALEGIAERSDISLARVVQEVVKEFLQNHKENQFQLFERVAPRD